MTRALLSAPPASAASPAAAVTPRRRRVGDIDLSADRAVWVTQKTRSADYESKASGPARIVSRPL